MLKIRIGLDAEFMGYTAASIRTLEPVYPNIAGREFAPLRSFGCDEFGHCLEARPKEGESAEELVTNTMKAMAELPDGVLYKTENAHLMEKKTFIQLIKAQGGKELPTCKNIMGQEILDDCKADLDARKAGKRLVFCGMHVHVSAEKKIRETFEVAGKTANKDINVPIKLPVKSLVHLFDKYLFTTLCNDPDFNIGRYRSPGFYELKRGDGSHFEYRSLGSTAFTPERVYLIFKIIEKIVKDFDHYNLCEVEPKVDITDKDFRRMVEQLRRTKHNTKDLKSLWVPWQ
jgi:hypothetical protein